VLPGENPMNSFKVIELKESIFSDNNSTADQLRERLKKENTCLVNLMSSPGSGKTSTLVRTIEILRSELKIGVMEADIDSTVDATKIAETGVRAIQLHTGGMCHLDANMTAKGINEFSTNGLDLVILENIGNLICPAEFDTGAVKNVMILSVPEGDDKPLKYPLMFSKVDALIINKIDCLPYFDFNLSLAHKRVRDLNPNIKIFEVSAKTGQGFTPWCEWLRTITFEWKKK
jgi:hydrogenase nickel incorporation protein HypB